MSSGRLTSRQHEFPQRRPTGEVTATLAELFRGQPEEPLARHQHLLSCAALALVLAWHGARDEGYPAPLAQLSDRVLRKCDPWSDHLFDGDYGTLLGLTRTPVGLRPWGCTWLAVRSTPHC